MTSYESGPKIPPLKHANEGGFAYHMGEALEDLLEHAVLHVVGQEVQEEEVGGGQLPIVNFRSKHEVIENLATLTVMLKGLCHENHEFSV